VDVAVSAEAAVDGVDGVVNGTPVGMYLQPGTPVDLAAIGDQQWLFDAIYSPIETELMQRAADAKLARISGFDLFLGQGIDAFEIFT
jgi:shikimate dehydrogenase